MNLLKEPMMSPRRAVCLRNRPLAALLMCGTAMSPLTAAAQDAAARPTALAPIIVGVQADDSTTVVAETLSMGGKIATDVLDTAASISVVTSKELRQRGVATAEQALQYTPGIVTDFYGGDERFDYFKIRGFDAFAYRDGLTLGRPFGNAREEIYSFERVEVLRGANSTLFGVSDPGGAVNYVTKRPRDIRFGEAYATVGSFSSKEVGVDFGDNLTPDGSLSYRFTAKVRDANAELDHSRNDTKFVMGGLTWRPTDATSVGLVLDYVNLKGTSDSGQPLGTDYRRSRFFGEPEFDYRENERSSISLFLDHDFGGGLTLSANARYTDQKINYGYVYLYTLPDTSITDRYYFSNDSDGDVFTSDIHLAYDGTFGAVQSRTLVGLQYEDRSSRSAGLSGYVDRITNPDDFSYIGKDQFGTPTASNSSEKNETKGIYLQQDFTFDHYILNLGLRRDWFDAERENPARQENSFGETTGRVGLTYKVTPELSIYGSYAESTVISTSAPRSASALNLDPERGEQFEIGAKYQPEGMRAIFSGAIYDLRKTNVARPVFGIPDTFEQVGEIRSRGFELEARSELTNVFSMIASYSYTDSEILDDQSENHLNSLLKVPAHLASLWGNYTLFGNGTRGDMTFGLGARYTGTYFNEDANVRKSESAVIVDAAYSYDLRPDVSLALNVTNVFDQKHDTGGLGIYYNPGREVSATIRRTW